MKYLTLEVDEVAMTDSEQKKVTSEKPVSSFPIPFKEFVSALLKVKPVSKKEMDKAIKAHEKKKQKPK